MAINNFNVGEIGERLKTLQNQVEQFTKMQQQQNTETAPTSPNTEQTQTNQTSTYPKVWRSDTVEDILNNPQWKQELGVEFAASDLGLKAKNYSEMLFMEFCEKQTGQPSIMLNELRKSAQMQEEKKVPKPTVPKNKESTPVG